MIEVFEELASTSGTLLERLSSGAAVPEGQWVVANRQTSGRGRQGRAWFDGSGNFMGSTFVASHAGDPPLGTLALAAGLAVRDAVLKHLPAGREVLLKWPNDLLADGAKLSGILLEGARGGVVVGIGVNLAVAPNGDVYVRGEKVDTNQEVYQAICKWLSSAGFMPAPA